MIADVFSSVKLSLFKVCGDFAAKAATDLSIAAPKTWVFDGFSETNSLPAGDLVGLYKYSLDLDTELATISTMIALSTDNDLNLMRLDTLTARLLKLFLPNTSIPIYDSENPGTVAGNMKVTSGTSVSPVYAALQRPLKFISITGKLSLAVQNS